MMILYMLLIWTDRVGDRVGLAPPNSAKYTSGDPKATSDAEGLLVVLGRPPKAAWSDGGRAEKGIGFLRCTSPGESVGTALLGA